LITQIYDHMDMSCVSAITQLIRLFYGAIG